MSRSAVIVSTARTGIGRAYRGAFNATPAPTLGAHSIKAAVERAGIDPAEVQDVVFGAALQQGSTAGNIARTALLRAGLPVTVAGMSVDRQCASGLMAIATAAKEIIVDNMDIAIGGGVESISLVQTPAMRVEPDRELLAMHGDIYMPMLQTAEVVAARYGIGRDRCDAYALQSQQRTAAAQAAGKFDDEIVPVTATMNVVNKETKEVSQKEITLAKDEGNRPETTAEGLASLQPVLPNGTVTAGNASSINDGAALAVLTSEKAAAQRGLKPLARIVAQASHAQDPAWFTTAPIECMRKVLKKANLKTTDIDLFEINEAFAVVTMAAIKELSLDAAKVNPYGGAVALGHPIGASGARLVATLLNGLAATGKRRGLAALCIGGGEASAVIVEML